MQWSLVLLILVGQCSLFTCQLYNYHFINQNKSWYEAQKYCREKYTDLASVYEETDINRLQTSNKEAWIGLYNEPVTNKTEWKWRWSQAAVEYTENQTKWKDGEPNNKGGNEYCVITKASISYWDTGCAKEPRPFICHNATNLSDKFYVSKERKTWLQARKYCRENHTDLVSGKAQLEDQELSSKLQDKIDYWIGLFRVTWRWSDGRSSFFRPWNQIFADNQPDNDNNNTCAMLDKEGRWRTDNCNSTKPFFCYSDKVILIKENKTWEEAINHCRENYKDLISITDAEQQRWVQERAKDASSSHVWLALRFTCILETWFWVTDERVDYKNWASNVKMDDCNMSGAMETGGQHKWYKEDDMMKFNFFCSKF